MWAKFDDRYPWNRKVRPLSDAAFRLDVSAVCWSSEYLTDGVISPDDLPQVSDVKRPQLAAAELVRRGRWHASGHDCPDCPDVPPGGHVVHHFLDYNPPREKVEADREKRRQAGQMGGKASGRSRANAKQSASDLLNKSEAQVASSPTNTRTRTRSPSGYVGGEVTEVDARDPDEPPRCPPHSTTPPDLVPPCRACGALREGWETQLRADVVFARPSWCGECDPHTRLREITTDGGEALQQCRVCHPLAVTG